MEISSEGTNSPKAINYIYIVKYLCKNIKNVYKETTNCINLGI